MFSVSADNSYAINQDEFRYSRKQIFFPQRGEKLAQARIP
jgi:hypothetical protein